MPISLNQSFIPLHNIEINAEPIKVTTGKDKGKNFYEIKIQSFFFKIIYFIFN